MKEVWDPKEIGELNKNDVAGFKQKSETPTSKVKILGQMTKAFDIGRGQRQGDVLSTTLFNIVLEKVIRNTETHLNGTIFNRVRQYIAYVDDVLIAGQ